MKDEFAFLYPAPRSVRIGGGVLDIRSLCFPLEISKRFGFLFEHFRVRSRSRGLEVVFQERPSRSPTRGRDLAGDAYAIDGGPERIVLSAGTARARFYALSTLMQVLAFHERSGRVPAFTLRDAPALAFRGFLFAGEPTGSRLRRLLLELALLKFSHFALPARAVLQGRLGAENDLEALAALVRKMGLELIVVDADPQALFRFGRAAASGCSPEAPVFFPAAAPPEAWLDFFLDQHRLNRAGGGRTAVWGDMFLRHAEWIRKLPQDILVLNRERSPERGDVFRTAVLPFKKHHIPQALCPVLCTRDRFVPDARAGMARVSAACAAAATGKLAGVMLVSCEPEDCACLPEGAVMLHFQAGSLLWGGKLPGPGAFSRWALGRDEPDLFRVYSFLGQAEHRLLHPHTRYLFEDPLLAPFSRQGDPNEVAAHFRKAALYLQKREIPHCGLTGFVDFVRRLYELIAAKVEFSARLGALLGDAGGEEEVSRRTSGLEQKAGELKDLFLGLQGEHVLPTDSGRALKGFDFLSGRFAYLRRAASSPAAREGLRRELGDSSALASLAAPGGDEAEWP